MRNLSAHLNHREVVVPKAKKPDPNALKGCICGNGYPTARTDENNRYHFIVCGVCSRATIHCRTKEEAVTAWNE
jgi:hypothetical protein